MSIGHLVEANDLVLQKDIVERLGMNPTLVANLASGRKRNTEFPRPIAGKGSRGIWLWSDVEKWYLQFRTQTVDGQRSAGSKKRVRRNHIAF